MLTILFILLLQFSDASNCKN